MPNNGVHLTAHSLRSFAAGDAERSVCNAMKPIYIIVGVLVLTSATALPAAELPPLAPGSLDWDWVGNTHSEFKPGKGNGEGRWVQNFIDEMEVAPDGTVVVGSHWDEGGRSIGLYKDGTVNRSCLGKNDRKGGHRSGGWGTSNQAMTVSGDEILLASTDGELYRFSWKPGDIESAVEATKHEHGDLEREQGAVQIIAMNARGGRVAIALKDGRIEVRDQCTWTVQKSFAVDGTVDLCWGGEGTLWIATAAAVTEFAADGRPTGRAITDAGQPSALALAPDGRLVVCDDGQRQQVRFYDLTAEPRLVGTFGQEGGIHAGTPGQPAPEKLMRPAGANLDAAGNLYVGLRYDEKTPSGGFILRCFDPAGKLKWEQACHLFSEVWDVTGDRQGNLTAYGFRSIFTKRAGAPRGAWELSEVTLDSRRQVDDPRYRDSATRWPWAMHQATTLMRELDGKRYLFTWGSGGNSPLEVFRLHADGYLAQHVLTQGGHGPWAFDVDERGGLWWDAGHTTLWRRPYVAGAWGEPERHPLPPGMTEVHRIVYDAANDRLYASGYSEAIPKPAGEWGLVGRVMMRVDGYLTDKPKVVWTSSDLRLDDDGLPPKSMAWAGEYLFTAACKPTAGLRGQIYVYRVKDGTFVGRISAPREIAEQTGWVDLSHGLRARLLPDGRYAITQEDNWHAKVIVHLWKPKI
mgnify:FL=1